MSGLEGDVDSIVQSLHITNLSSSGFGAPLIEGLIYGEKFVQHVAVVDLLCSDAFVDFVISACDIQGRMVDRIADSCSPLREFVT